MVDDGVARDPEGPRREGSPIVIKPRERAEDPLEDEMRQVLRVLAAANAHGDVAVDRSDQRVVKPADGHDVARGRGDRKLVDRRVVRER